MGGFLSHLTPDRNSEVIDAPFGPIRGNIYRHENNEKIVNGYLGIPFAKPPVGDLRFRKPVEAEKWSQPLDCYHYGPGCPQSGQYGAKMIDDAIQVGEDNCLTLNVFAPEWTSREFPSGLPVMLYFYYGGFEVGMSSFLDDYSLTGTLPLRDIVLVTCNYRVGPLGFLTTGDDVAVGNYGLWDQTLCLQWIQKHIGFFGGDPHNVTVFGTSAGGASADLLALSPHSNKLFRRFLASSGTAFCDFAIRRKEDQATVFREFAEFHGYTGNDSDALFKWYSGQDASKFAECDGFQTTPSGFLSFAPNFDGDFFPKPFDILRKEAPRMEVMITVGEFEGLGIAMSHPAFADSTFNFPIVVAEVYGPDIADDPTEVQWQLIKSYLTGVDQGDLDEVDVKLVEFIGDSYFNIGALDTARSCVKHGDTVYLASFDYCNPTDPVLGQMPFRGATHGSEMRYILGENLMRKFTPVDDDKLMMHIMGGFVSNFAKYGDPNGSSPRNEGQWTPYSLEAPLRYFKIDLPRSGMRENFQKGRLEIYDEIHKNSPRYRKIVFGED